MPQLTPTNTTTKERKKENGKKKTQRTNMKRNFINRIFIMTDEP
jgi:hypothetical protein